MTNYSKLIQFSVLHRSIRRACAHAVSEDPPTTIDIETQPGSDIGSLCAIFCDLLLFLTINSVTTGARELNGISLLSLATHNAKGEMREI